MSYQNKLPESGAKGLNSPIRFGGKIVTDPLMSILWVKDNPQMYDVPQYGAFFS
jgi:hypothetical protein